MKELDQFTFEQLAKWIDAGKEALDRHDGIRMAGVHVASLAKIALSAKVESEPHRRREIHAGGNTWIQCSKQAYDRAEAAGERVRILYERPELNSPETPDGWVACDERMPEVGERDWRTALPVIVKCEIGVIPAYYGFVYQEGEKCFGFMESFRFGDGSGTRPEEHGNRLMKHVTHWMPLPAAPKPEK